MHQLTMDQATQVSGGISAGEVLGYAEIAFGVATADPLFIVLGVGDVIASSAER